jgi:heptosyltransferase-2
VLQVERRDRELRTPGERVEGVRRLVVVRDDRLGDVVLTLPAVAALRRAYPDARLALMVRPGLASLAHMVPVVDEVLEASGGRGRIEGTLRAFEPDLVVCVSRGAAVAWAAARARVPHRVGTGYRLYSPLFTRTVAERRRSGGRHEAEYALSFAHRAGAPAGPAEFPLDVPGPALDAAGEWVAEHAPDGPVVVLHAGSGGSCPRWPFDRFVELAERLRAGGAGVVFSIGPADAWVAQALDAAPAAVRALPRFRSELARLPALLREAALVVGNSTGPLHLAAALGTATLGVYAPWPTCAAARWGPYATNGWAVAACNEEAVRWSRRERRARGEGLLGGVPAALVARSAASMLGGRPPGYSQGG